MNGTAISTSRTSMNMQSKDICLILMTCKEAGVSEIEVGDLKVKFGKFQHLEAESLDISLTEVRQNINNKTTDAVDHDAWNELSEEDQLTHTMLSDPAAYEELV